MSFFLKSTRKFLFRRGAYFDRTPSQCCSSLHFKTSNSINTGDRCSRAILSSSQPRAIQLQRITNFSSFTNAKIATLEDYENHINYLFEKREYHPPPPLPFTSLLSILSIYVYYFFQYLPFFLSPRFFSFGKILGGSI